MSEQDSSGQNATTAPAFNPKRAAIGCIVLLVLFGTCGTFVWKWIAGVPDYVTMGRELVDKLYLDVYLATNDLNAASNVDQMIRNEPRTERLDFAKGVVDDLFARGWHIDVTRNWEKYPENLDAEWYKHEGTVSIIKECMAEELVERAERPAGVIR